jgi:hypothetical protein
LWGFADPAATPFALQQKQSALSKKQMKDG